MASKATLYRRMAAAADERRIVRPFFTQPAGYQNRQDRRRAARVKRRALEQNRHEVPQPITSQALEMIESEAPT